MSWRDQLQTASFREIPFFVTTSDTQIGRRNVLHEYPKQDIPYAEDLGRACRKYRVTAIVIGDDYMIKRNRLAEALEEYGPGTLIHPYLGVMSAVVLSASIAEAAAEEGRQAKFQIEFAEAGESEIYPAEYIDTKTDVAEKAEAVIEAAATFVESQFSKYLSMASSIKETVQNKIDTIYEAVGAVKETISTIGQISDFINQVITDISAIAEMVENIPGQIMKELDNLISIFDGRDDLVSSTSYAGKETNRLLNALSSMIVVTALSVQAKVISDMEFDGADGEPKSKTEATQLQTRISGRLYQLLPYISGDMYDAVIDLRAAIIADISERGVRLPEIDYITLQSPLPILVLSYKLYGDSSRYKEIIARNPIIKHPGFVPANIKIEYLKG